MAQRERQHYKYYNSLITLIHMMMLGQQGMENPPIQVSNPN